MKEIQITELHKNGIIKNRIIKLPGDDTLYIKESPGTRRLGIYKFLSKCQNYLPNYRYND